MTQHLATDARTRALQRTPIRVLIAQLTTLAIDDGLQQLKLVPSRDRESSYQRLILTALRDRIDHTLKELV